MLRIANKTLWLVIVALVVFFSSLSQAAAPTFCKCTCFKNSTLIQLGPESSSSSSSRSIDLQADAEILAGRSASASCSQCTRAFCLSHNLPICKDADESDTVATCFQRDSRKDEIIVWAFILGTTGLLAWAAVKRLSEYRDAKKASLPGNTAPRSATPAGGAYTPLDGAGSHNAGLRR